MSVYVRFKLSSSDSFRDMGVLNLHEGSQRPSDAFSVKIFTPEVYTTLSECV